MAPATQFKWHPLALFDERFQTNLTALRGRDAALADRLSGLYLTPFDDLDRLLKSIEEIEKDKLYSLRVKSLSTSPAAASIAAIRDSAERPVE